MEKDETMLALEDDLGSIVMSQHITPGIYYVSATMGDEAIPNEYYIAERALRTMEEWSLNMKQTAI